MGNPSSDGGQRPERLHLMQDLGQIEQSSFIPAFLVKH
jgi:hypothetical protein